MHRNFPPSHFLVVMALAGVCSCRPHYPPNVLVHLLRSPDAGQRRDAADDLADLPPEPWILPHLLYAAQIETDPDALKEILIALGQSGAQEALTPIQQRLYSPTDPVRAGAKAGLRRWRIQNGQPERQVPLDWDIELYSPDADEREEICDDIRKGGNAHAALPYLARALAREHDEGVRQKLLLAIASSGTDDAKGIIDQSLASPDEDTRKAARKAAALWQSKQRAASSSDRSSVGLAIAAGVLAGLAASNSANQPRTYQPPLSPQPSAQPFPTSSAYGVSRQISALPQPPSSSTEYCGCWQQFHAAVFADLAKLVFSYEPSQTSTAVDAYSSTLKQSIALEHSHDLLAFLAAKCDASEWGCTNSRALATLSAWRRWDAGAAQACSANLGTRATGVDVSVVRKDAIRKAVGEKTSGIITSHTIEEQRRNMLIENAIRPAERY